MPVRTPPDNLRQVHLVGRMNGANEVSYCTLRKRTFSSIWYVRTREPRQMRLLFVCLVKSRTRTNFVTSPELWNTFAIFGVNYFAVFSQQSFFLELGCWVRIPSNHTSSGDFVRVSIRLLLKTNNGSFYRGFWTSSYESTELRFSSRLACVHKSFGNNVSKTKISHLAFFRYHWASKFNVG